MERESLEIVQENIANMVDVLDIPIYDKIEILINLIQFLDPNQYEENIKILMKSKENRKID